MGTYPLIGMALAIAALLCLKRFSRKGFENNRSLRPLADFHKSVEGQMSIGVFIEVWSKLGESFSVDPRLIQPDDKLKVFAGFDSWDLGRGDEALGQWLKERGAGKPPTLDTVLDLAKWVENATRRTSESRPAAAS